jgi:outer membrane protein OmpA-like peptidoglycan-associated protein
LNSEGLRCDAKSPWSPCRLQPPLPPIPPPPSLDLAPVYFAYKEHGISEVEKDALNANLAALEPFKARADLAVILEGHADSRGGSEYNDGLSSRRIAAVSSYLTSQIGPGACETWSLRVVPSWNGSRAPLCEAPAAMRDWESCHAENRVVRLELASAPSWLGHRICTPTRTTP